MDNVAPEILIAAFSGLGGITAGGLLGYFVANKLLAGMALKRAAKLKEEQREAVRSALEIFRPFHWGVLHLAILTERSRQKESGPDDSELRDAYSKALVSLHEEFKTLMENGNAYDFGKMKSILPVDLTDEILKIIHSLGEAGRLVEGRNQMTECFQLVESAYKDASGVEKKLRSLYRSSS